MGTATFAVFDLDAAVTLFGRGDRVDGILVAGSDGVDPAALRADLAQALPQASVTTAAEQDRFTLDGLEQFISIIRIALLVFGGVAVLVGAFTIFNTLSITVAQRTRELGLLRMAGAERRQVLGLGAGRGARARRARVRGGPRRGARAGDRARRVLRLDRDRAARGGHGVRDADDRRLAPARHRRDAGRRARAGVARDAGPAGRGAARRRAGRRARPAPRPDRPRAGRPARPPRPGARRRGGRARPAQRDAPAGADGRDRRRADDRRGARHARHRRRRRAQGHHARRARAAARRRLRRHRRGRLVPDRSRGRARGGDDRPA